MRKYVHKTNTQNVYYCVWNKNEHKSSISFFSLRLIVTMKETRWEIVALASTFEVHAMEMNHSHSQHFSSPHRHKALSLMASGSKILHYNNILTYVCFSKKKNLNEWEIQPCIWGSLRKLWVSSTAVQTVFHCRSLASHLHHEHWPTGTAGGVERKPNGNQ